MNSVDKEVYTFYRVYEVSSDGLLKRPRNYGEMIFYDEKERKTVEANILEYGRSYSEYIIVEMTGIRPVVD